MPAPSTPAGLFGVRRDEPVNEALRATAPVTLNAPPSYDATCGLWLWGMQGNDTLSNCFWAAVAHSKMLHALTASTDKGEKPVYIPGFIPPSAHAGKNWYDRYLIANGQPTTPPGPGTGIYSGAQSMLTQHLALYVAVLGPTDGSQYDPAVIRQVIFDFQGGAIFCLALDPDAREEFAKRVPWGTESTQPDAALGHAVSGAAYTPQGLTFITWGRPQLSTDQFDTDCIDGIVLMITKSFATRNGEDTVQRLVSEYSLTSIWPPS